MIARASARVAMAVVLAACASCDGTDADVGYDASLQIEGAQFFRGAPPASIDGPAVASVNLGTDTARAGMTRKPLKGALGATASAAAIQLAGDRGYWVVRARAPELDAPDLPSYSASLAFAKELAEGDYDLVVRAVAAGGAFGPPSARTLHVVREDTPEGRLVVALSWSGEADLDLRVVDPLGIEISKGNRNSYSPPPPGEQVDPKAWEAGGILDFDSNAKCAIDARNRENVVWKGDPPKGRYVVRVDTFSLCRATSAAWSVTVVRDGAVLGRATGASVEWDTRFSHDVGAGVLAVEFDVP